MGSVVLADILKIAVHDVLVAGCGWKVSKPERVQVNCRVRNVAQGEEV
jgi:hypothetical protein